MPDYVLASAIEKVAAAIEAYAAAQIVAAKIEANSDQRVAGNTAMFIDYSPSGDR